MDDYEIKRASGDNVLSGTGFLDTAGRKRCMAEVEYRLAVYDEIMRMRAAPETCGAVVGGSRRIHIERIAGGRLILTFAEN